MKYRTFGKTDWQVSEIGFGAWGIGGGWGPVDDQESIRTLLEAWEQGINFVDTAEMYGKGHSEEVIGRALKAWSGDPIYVATKVQPVQWPPASEHDPVMSGRYPRAYMIAQCEASLRRLGTEAIDVYQLHGWFPQGIEQTEWYDTLLELQKAGKIRTFGVSIRDYRPQDGVELAQRRMVDAQQVVFNIFEQRPLDALLPACAENQVGVIARVPFDEGSLVGNWTPEWYDQLAPDDFRRKYFKDERFAATYNKVEQLKALVRETTGDQYRTLAEVSLRYCLSASEVSCVIPGIKNRFELMENVKASDGDGLPPELLEALRAFNWPRNYHDPNSGVDPT